MGYVNVRWGRFGYGQAGGVRSVKVIWVVVWQVRSVELRFVSVSCGRHVVFGSVLAGCVGVCQGWAGEVGSVLVDQVGCGSAGLVRLDWFRSGLVT